MIATNYPLRQIGTRRLDILDKIHKTFFSIYKMYFYQFFFNILDKQEGGGK